LEDTAVVAVATPTVTRADEPYTNPQTGACVTLAFRYEAEANEPFVVMLLADSGEVLKLDANPTDGQARACWLRRRDWLAGRGFRRMRQE